MFSPKTEDHRTTEQSTFGGNLRSSPGPTVHAKLSLEIAQHPAES